jgi:hypothetical protein
MHERKRGEQQDDRDAGQHDTYNDTACLVTQA